MASNEVFGGRNDSDSEKAKSFSGECLGWNASGPYGGNPAVFSNAFRLDVGGKVGLDGSLMIFAEEYRLQGILGLLQSVLIVAGCMGVGVALKVRGYPDAFSEIPGHLFFVRNWGFLLILLPLMWSLGTI